MPKLSTEKKNIFGWRHEKKIPTYHHLMEIDKDDE